jgi:MarR family 2-MHQ and catechol resistance regulon transcriptional repressor
VTRKENTLKALTSLLRASSSVEKVVRLDMTSYGLNSTEFAVMELLYNKGRQPIQMVGKRILLASSSITYVIDKLEEKKLVERVADEKDRRVTFADLTEMGRQKMEEIFPQHAQTIEKLFEGLSDEEINQLRQTLKRIGYTAAEKINE